MHTRGGIMGVGVLSHMAWVSYWLVRSRRRENAIATVCQTSRPPRYVNAVEQ